MLPYDKLQTGFANKQTTRNLRLSWCFAAERRRKNLSAKTKVEDACQLRPSRQVLKQSDWNNWVGVTYMLVWSRRGYFGSTTSRQNTNHGSTKLAWYAAEAYQKGTIRYKYLQTYRKLNFWRETGLGYKFPLQIILHARAIADNYSYQVICQRLRGFLLRSCVLKARKTFATPKVENI